jgi:hypothetical protein
MSASQQCNTNTINTKRISDYFPTGKAIVVLAEDSDLTEILTKKVKTNPTSSTLPSQKSTCDKTSDVKQLLSQDSLNLEAIEFMLNGEEEEERPSNIPSKISSNITDNILLSSSQQELIIEKPLFDKGVLINLLPFATTDFGQECPEKSLVYKHSKSKLAPVQLSTLLIPKLDVYNLELTLMSWIIILTGLNWVEKFEENLKESNRMTLFKDANLKSGYLLKIELEYRTSVKKFMNIQPLAFMNFLKVHATPNESSLAFIKANINDEKLYNRYLTHRENLRNYFRYSSLISASKIESTKIKFYFAFNTSEYIDFSIFKATCNLTKDRYTQLSSTYNINYENSPPKLLEMFVLEHVITYLLNQGFPGDGDNLWALNKDIRFYESSNPYFYFADLLYGLFKYDEKSLEFNTSVVADDFLQQVTNDAEDVLTIKIKVFKHLVSYRSTLKSQQAHLNSLVMSKNANKPERIDKVLTKLSNTFQKANNLDNWLPKDKNGQIIIPRQKHDVDEIILAPALLQISRKELTAEECYHYIQKQFLEADSKCGIEIRAKLRYIKASLYTLESEVGCNGTFKERRECFSEFLTNFTLDGISFEEEITEVLIHPSLDDMLLAIEEFILLSLGGEFIYYFMHVVMVFDQSTKLTKGPGNIIKIH